MLDALAIRKRPKSFGDVVGQDVVLKTIISSLKTKRVHHSYCFIGPRGTGKTTVSRIFAKCLNCLVGITTLPCNCCAACLDVEGGRKVDFVEIDAATHRGIEEMVSALEGSLYSPVLSRFKIFVIDEAHQLTPQAFCSMLKVLEEPPGHAKFVLCSTDLTKIPTTILSRSINLYFKLISPDQMGRFIASVLKEEGEQFSSDVPKILTELADGSVRDALSILDRTILASQNKLITQTNIIKAFGIPTRELMTEILRAIIRKDLRSLLFLTEKAKYQSIPLPNIMSAVLSQMHELLNHQSNSITAPNKHKFWCWLIEEGAFASSNADVRSDALSNLKILMEGLKEMKLTDNHQTAFGIAMARAILNTKLNLN
ncbi:DNA polymerase III subunit tau [Candidatus Tremblaya phenacola PAVE]|nr:DNA polymerase III subunit tau [Candidatus Tremblaya phenacola PAVE]